MLLLLLFYNFVVFSLILFHVMGLVLRRRNGTEKNTLLSLLFIIIIKKDEQYEKTLSKRGTDSVEQFRF